MSDYQQRIQENHCTQATTSNVNNTWALLQTTGDKDEQNIVVFMLKS
jgi:hypothetical protein